VLVRLEKDTQGVIPDLVPTACLCLAAGLVLGVAHFLGLYANSRLYVQRGATGKAIALHALRIALTSVGLVAIAQFGAAPLLAAFVGFLIARPAVRYVVVGSH
jgi:F1F0 ATPase subunit 2